MLITLLARCPTLNSLICREMFFEKTVDTFTDHCLPDVLSVCPPSPHIHRGWNQDSNRDAPFQAPSFSCPVTTDRCCMANTHSSKLHASLHLFLEYRKDKRAHKPKSYVGTRYGHWRVITELVKLKNQVWLYSTVSYFVSFLLIWWHYFQAYFARLSNQSTVSKVGKFINPHWLLRRWWVLKFNLEVEICTVPKSVFRSVPHVSICLHFPFGAHTSKAWLLPLES